jgi:hypothetical protein
MIEMASSVEEADKSFILRTQNFGLSPRIAIMSIPAAWIKEFKAKPLVIDSASFPRAGPDEVVVKNAAVAVNPVNWKI